MKIFASTPILIKKTAKGIWVLKLYLKNHFKENDFKTTYIFYGVESVDGASDLVYYMNLNKNDINRIIYNNKERKLKVGKDSRIVGII